MSAFDRLFAMKDLSSLKSPRPVFAANDTIVQSTSMGTDKPLKPPSTYVSANLFSPVPRINQSTDIIKPIPFRGGSELFTGHSNPFLVPSKPTSSLALESKPGPIPNMSASFVSNMQAIVNKKSSDLSVSFEEFIQKDLDGDLPPQNMTPKPKQPDPPAIEESIKFVTPHVVLYDWRSMGYIYRQAYESETR